MNLSEDPTISLLPANLGNRLFQFFAAMALLARAGKGTVSNTTFPEWGLEFPRREPNDYRRHIVIDKIGDFDIDFLLEEIAADPSLFITVRHHLQKQSLYLSKDYYAKLLPIISDVPIVGDDKLLINVRAGDILGGATHWYTLLPISFYQDLVSKTGLSPVFIGQLENGAYVNALRDAFPDATFLPSRGAITDFDTIRQASHIVPAVSTFSLAAAWMSQAKSIHLPLSGFLNPAHMPDIDLVPTEDVRYRFYLFPLYFALPQAEALRHHLKIDRSWKEISRTRLAVLQRNAPLVSQYPAGINNTSVADFDEVFYVHANLDVALDISNGWYHTGLQHYKDIGRKLGYRASPAEPRRTQYPNLALNRLAWQSSHSIWSKGRGPQEDAMIAVNGDRASMDCFHTNLEVNPWWIVDCGAEFALKEIHIYNRMGPLIIRDRARPLRVECSRADLHWTIVHQTDPGHIFGGPGPENNPLIITPNAATICRFVRISIPHRETYLHLTEVEVYGILC